jgi:hypothetical protein
MSWYRYRRQDSTAGSVDYWSKKSVDESYMPLG